MIPAPITEVDKSALQALIENQVSEGKTIEYKREMPGKAESKEVPFLATVTSFANTVGGDLLLGVEACKGMPTNLLGVELDDVDAEVLRLEHVMRAGLEPRLPHVDIQAVSIENGRYVLVIRIPNSWNAPHRVKRNSKFYGRTSAGRYDLDVSELRTAFTRMENIAQRVRDFRADRIGKIYGRQSPVPVCPGGLMVIHFLPLSAFAETKKIDIARYSAGTLLRPIQSSGYNQMINLDGVVTFCKYDDRNSYAYTQTFRSGGVEAVCVLSNNGHMILPSIDYEQDTIGVLKEYLEFAEKYEIGPPYFGFLSFVGVKGCRFALPSGVVIRRDTLTLQEEMLVLPEIIIQDRGIQAERALKPLFDMVWNVFGLTGSRNYDEGGNWKPR